MRSLCAWAIVVAASAAAPAATQTYVSLAGRDDTVPKLGRPAITVHVAPTTASEAGVVMNEVRRGLARLAHTRPLSGEEKGEYELVVDLEVASLRGAARTIPFTASLATAEGTRLWRIEGRTETTDAASDPAAYVSIGRNIVSALIHDGWVAPRIDPDDPPPPPPQIRTDDSAR